MFRLCVFILTFILYLQPANAFVAGTVGAGLGVLQERIFSNVDKSVNNFFNRMDDTITHARGSAEGLLDSAKNDMESFLHKSVNELDNQERQLWLFYNMALNKLNKNIENSIRTGKVAALDLGNVVHSVNPFGSKDPVVFWTEVTPPLYVHKAVNRTITAYGLNLHHGSSRLTANGRAATPSGAYPSKASFRVNGLAVAQGVQLVFNFTRKRTLWFAKKTKRVYRLSPVQDKIGNISIVYTTDSYPTKSRVWPSNGKTFDIECQNSGSVFKGDRCLVRKNGVVQALKGYSIIPNTVRFRIARTHGSIKSNGSKFFNVSGNSFSYDLSLRARQGAGRRIRGSYSLSWAERKDVPNKIESKSPFRPLLLSESGLSVNIPKNATPVALEFQVTGGKKERLNLTSPRRPINSHYVKGSGVVELTWKRGA